MSLVLLSGRSGSGKSVALRALEDQGFYCVDNIPVSLLPSLVQKVSHDHAELAFSIDARNQLDELAQFEQVYEQLATQGPRPLVIFTDAEESTLLKRFSETRRRHPLTHAGLSLNEAIARERELLSPIASRADLLIDTTTLSSNKLRELVLDRVLGREGARLDILFESFGYKNGVPIDADYVFDARCLANPHWDPVLRPHSGRDEPVIHFFEQQPRVAEFIWQVRIFLETWLPRFEQENRSYLTVAIGCTGGQHRSVYVAEQLAAHFRQKRPHTQVRHRDIK
ncbi:MAG TPA: RNase adapter RapZ [Permianibacter sp.]|nr:RNase adapter RapZ [Permianibacter sp.]